MKILIDPGHGRNTPGKCSPDGRFREYQYTREIAAAVVARLQALGHDAEVLVPEFEDITLPRSICRAIRFGWTIPMEIRTKRPASPYLRAPAARPHSRKTDSRIPKRAWPSWSRLRERRLLLGCMWRGYWNTCHLPHSEEPLSQVLSFIRPTLSTCPQASQVDIYAFVIAVLVY